MSPAARPSRARDRPCAWCATCARPAGETTTRSEIRQRIRDTASGRRHVGSSGRTAANREPVGADAIPLLDEQSAILEEGANAHRVPAGDLLEHGNEHAQRVVADDRPTRDLGDEPRLGGGDGQPVAAIDVEHHVNVGAAVADVDYALPRYAQLDANAVEGRNLAVTRGYAQDRCDLAGGPVELEARADDALGRDDPIERRFDDFLRRGGDDVEIELVAVDQ